MATTHTVKHGENLTIIARHYGFTDWHTIYDDPANAAFRRKRPNPHLILAGDAIVIPDRGPSLSPPAKPEFSLDVNDAITSGRFPDLTVKLLLTDKITVKDVKTDKLGNIKLTFPDVTRGTVDILDITDKTAVPEIPYTLLIRKGLVTDASNFCNVPNKRKVIDEIAAKHSITRRAAWGKMTPKYASMITDQDWDYEIVVLHHSGDHGDKEPVEIETKHMVKNGWDDVGYHYMIKPSGEIFEGRHLSLKGSHVEKANTHKIGILIMGDFEHEVWDLSDDTPTAKQLSAAEALIGSLNASFRTLTKLGGHRDYKKDTECPGGELYKLIPGLRSKTKLGGP
jgi:hypothetical protein